MKTQEDGLVVHTFIIWEKKSFLAQVFPVDKQAYTHRMSVFHKLVSKEVHTRNSSSIECTTVCMTWWCSSISQLYTFPNDGVLLCQASGESVYAVS